MYSLEQNPKSSSIWGYKNKSFLLIYPKVESINVKIPLYITILQLVLILGARESKLSDGSLWCEPYRNTGYSLKTENWMEL